MALPPPLLSVALHQLQLPAALFLRAPSCCSWLTTGATRRLPHWPMPSEILAAARFGYPMMLSGLGLLFSSTVSIGLVSLKGLAGAEVGDGDRDRDEETDDMNMDMDI